MPPIAHTERTPPRAYSMLCLLELNKSSAACRPTSLCLLQLNKRCASYSSTSDVSTPCLDILGLPMGLPMGNELDAAYGQANRPRQASLSAKNCISATPPALTPAVHRCCCCRRRNYEGKTVCTHGKGDKR